MQRYNICGGGCLRHCSFALMLLTFLSMTSLYRVKTQHGHCALDLMCGLSGSPQIIDRCQAEGQVVQSSR